jgi:hypothetical protein
MIVDILQKYTWTKIVRFELLRKKYHTISIAEP